MTYRAFVLWLTIAVNLFSYPLFSASLEQGEEKSPTAISMVSENELISPNEPFWVALRFSLQPGWHIYWKRAGDCGFAPAIKWNLPPGFAVGETAWPSPTLLQEEEIISFGYKEEVVLLIPLLPPPSIAYNENFTFQADLSWLVCSSDSCLPQQSSVTFSLPSIPKEQPVAINSETKDFFAAARAQLATAPANETKLRAQLNVDGLLLLTIEPKTAFNAIQKVLFFPLEDSPIDYHCEPLVSENESGWTVTLKTDEATDSSLLPIKGELVIEEAGSKKTAWNIDLTAEIEPQNEKQIGMADSAIGDEAFYLSEKSEKSAPAVSFLTVLFSAFLGGLLLNLMPCVLPVVSLKVLSFVKLAKERRQLVILYSLGFTLGVVLSFLSLAALLLLLQQGGELVGWGFQLQDPLFVILLALLLFILALSLLGVMELGLGLASWAGGKSSESKSVFNGFTSSFFSGVLATIVATPCTGPFLGTAMGFAVTLPPLHSFSIFFAVAIGMASPYLLLAAFPALLRFLPKPGVWMVYLKQAMGFLMLASVLWLLWVFSAHVGSEGLLLALGAFFIISIACWIEGVWDTPLKKRASRYAARSIAFVTLLSSIYLLKNASETPANFDNAIIADNGSGTKKSGSYSWETFDPERVAYLREQGIPVLIDFTARWCLICQANHIALVNSSVELCCLKKGVVRMKADWTRYDPVITKALNEFGRNSVPLYVIFPPHGEAVILPQILTPAVVLGYLENL